MGGGGGRSRGPSPAEQAAAQIRAQRAEQERIEAKRGRDADDFLSRNNLTQAFRDDILARSSAAAEKQFTLLGSQSGQSLQDIRQRNAARGLSVSTSAQSLTDQANRFNQLSRDDIFESARNRSDVQISDAQRFLDNAAGDIRGGRSVVTAQNAFRSDIQRANQAFEANLSRAATGNQRNSAFQSFENDRRSAAARFNESVNQFQQAGNLASIAAGQGGTDPDKDKKKITPAGGNFGGTLV